MSAFFCHDFQEGKPSPNFGDAQLFNFRQRLVQPIR
jgi:hypothetical protein